MSCSTTGTLAVGAEVICEAEFRNTLTNVLTDPDVVKFTIKDPSGNEDTYTYGSDPRVVRTATGEYYLGVDADEPGTWYFRAFSTGSGRGAKESSFEVSASNFNT